ncbi:MAG: hypothetical protein P8Y95_06110 [Gammaproteobacteria bacterium]|jgi:hypothetical protein
MRKTTMKLAASLLVVLSLPAAGAEYFDGNHTLLCTIAQIFECTPANGCVAVKAEEVDAPTYFLADFNKKIVVTTRVSQERRESAIENMDTIDDLLVIQGIEDGREDVPNDGAGWAMAVNNDDGGMSISAVTNGGALSGLGWCVPTD